MDAQLKRSSHDATGTERKAQAEDRCMGKLWFSEDQGGPEG